MKHLLITLDYPPNTGGVARYLEGLFGNLPPQEVVVLAHSRRGTKPKLFDKKQNYKIIRQKFSPKWYRLFKFVFKIIKEEKITCLHTSHVLPIGYVVLAVSKLKKIPYVVYLHGLDFNLAKRNSWKRFWLKIILNKASLLVVNSNYTRDAVLAWTAEYKNKTEVIYPCPADFKEVKPNLNLQKKYEGKKVLLTVARLVERKGHDKVLSVLPRLLTVYPNLVYVIVGTGEHEYSLNAAAQKLKVADHVDFVGFVPDKLLPNYFSLCDIFVMPCRVVNNFDVEGFGIVYLEANKFGKPVIAGKSGGAGEAVIDNETGLLVLPNDVNDLYNKIHLLLSDVPLAHKLGAYGQKRVFQEFNYANQAKKLQATFVKYILTQK